MKTNKTYLIFFIVTLLSCKENKELVFLRDTDYMEPSFRLDDSINNFSVYQLHERYFVYGYNYNKNKFIDSVLHFICARLNQDTVISRLELNFQDVGKYSFHEKNTTWDGSTTDYICSFVWDIKRPIQIKLRNNPYNHGELIDFPCNLNDKYEKITYE